MAVSIFHIGLPLDHPSIPVEERPKIMKRLSDLQERMTRAGYKYLIIQASPETGLDGFAKADFIGKQHALGERRRQRE